VALTPKQRLFVREYLRDLNATQAAVRSGYSRATAEKIGSENLHKPEVKEAIDAALAARELRVEVKADDVLRELLVLAATDLRDAYDETGKLLPPQDMPEHVAKAISSIKVFEEFEGHGADRVKVGEVREVKFYSKEKALELLGRHLKMFTDKFEVKVDGSFADALKKARERAQRR
jgi:phage terminase small subunit